MEELWEYSIQSMAVPSGLLEDQMRNKSTADMMQSIQRGREIAMQKMVAYVERAMCSAYQNQLYEYWERIK